MIPPIIHHVWPAHDPIPYTFRANLDTWQEHHPEWVHIVWTEADLDEMPMRNRDLYDQAKTLAPDDWIRWRADVARLEIVYQHGGVYADMDAESVAPLDPLLDKGCWFVESPNAHGHATQAVFASEAQHPFMAHLLDTMAESARRHDDQRINHRVGSRFVARKLQAWTLSPRPEMLPWYWFAGQSIKDRDAGHEPTAPTYVNHRYFNTSGS
jgi:mannosyltransferase OCH1-like enzyme